MLSQLRHLTGGALYLLDQQIHNRPQSTAFAKIRPGDHRHPRDPVLAEAVGVDHSDEGVESDPGQERMTISLGFSKMPARCCGAPPPRSFSRINLFRTRPSSQPSQPLWQLNNSSTALAHAGCEFHLSNEVPRCTLSASSCSNDSKSSSAMLQPVERRGHNQTRFLERL